MASFFKFSSLYTGVLVNVLAICIGSLLGIAISRNIPEVLKERCGEILGYCILVIALKMALEFQDAALCTLLFTVGALLGTQIKFEDRIHNFINRFQKARSSSPFNSGFINTSILYCTGSMAILGALESSLKGTHELYFTKGLLDGSIAIVLAAKFKWGVFFSFLPVLIYQGSLVLLSDSVSSLQRPEALANISGVGGIALLLIGLKMSKIKENLKIGDFLPSIFLVILYYCIV